MTDTANLGLPFIEASQAQKHVTHNEALRILDAAIQITVQDMNRTAPPTSPADGQRHVVAASPTGVWAGHANAIASWQDGAWAFLAAKAGWCVWSVSDAGLMVFDGTLWHDLRGLAIDNAAHVGVNTTAASPNLFSVKSNAALMAAINAADGGTGDVRLQLSKESAAKTSSVVFADSYSGRAEFGLIGSDAFKLKVSADGSVWADAFTIDQGSGNLALPHGLALTGVVAPPQITANQTNYSPAGAASASVLQLSSDAARSMSGLAGGIDGRVVGLINVGGQTITLLDENASSSAANRFTLAGDMSIPAKQAAILRYDATAGRWQAIARPAIAGGLQAANNLSDLTARYSARDNLSLHGADIASAATLNLEAATGDLIDVTGTTTITSIILSDGHERTIRFAGALTLTNSTSLMLPGGVNITTAAGDFAVVRGYPSGVVRCVAYTPAAGFLSRGAQPLTLAEQAIVRSNIATVWEPVTSASLNGMSSVELPIPIGFKTFKLHLENINPSAGSAAVLFARTSTNAGVSYEHGASDYNFQLSKESGSTPVTSNTTTDVIIVANGSGGRAGYEIDFEPGSGSQFPNFQWRGAYLSASNLFEKVSGAGGRLNTGRINALLFAVNTGTFITGEVYLEGRR